MTVTDRLYNVSADIPNDANDKLVFSGSTPYGFGTNQLHGWDVMTGYSSGVLLEDVGGPYGTLVIGTGGHTRLQNQLLSLNVSQDSPMFDWWQQPYYETSAVNGAELYYSPAEFVALPSNRKTGDGGGTEQALSLAWVAAGGFSQGSMGYEGWIFPSKLTYGQLGKNNPHGFRYHAPCYIPPSFTGTGAGAYVCIEAPQGPFSQSWQPSGASVSDMVVPGSIWPSGRRKFPIWVKNTQTRAWTRLSSWQPDYMPYGFVRQHSAVARDQKRVYVSVDVGGGTAGYWFIDFTNGIAGATVSSVTQGAAPVGPNRGSAGAFTDGHPTGRHLWFWANGNPAKENYLILQDLDAGTNNQVGPIGGYSTAYNGGDAFMYDSANNRILVVRRPLSNSISYLAISIPADPTNAAAYSVSSRTLTIDSGASVSDVSLYHKKCFLHPTLGVVFIPQNTGRMLAFRPS
jgi:hypothetical protein